MNNASKLSLEGLTFQATKINVEENVLTVTLNRPEKKNALNNVMINEICYALSYAKQERGIRVVIIAAEGDVFCAGADLKRQKAESNVPKIEGSDDISLLIRHLYKPVICKIQGSVHAGALLMVTNCTHAIAVENAKFSAPEIKATYLTFDQANATAIRTNMRVQVVGVGFCANSECCKLESCDPEDLMDCIQLEEMTPDDGLCGGENDDNACSPMIDGLASRQFQYPEDKTMWLQRSVRLLTIFNSTEHGSERLESAARIIADKNPEFTSHVDIETPSSAGGAMNVTCKYVTAATVLAYLQTPIQRAQSNLPKTVINVIGFFPSSGDDEFVITIDVPPGMGSNNRIWIENSGQPSRPRILNYPVPKVDKIYLESDPTIVEGNQCSGGAGCQRQGFIVTSVGQVAIVEGNNFGPSCTELEVPKSCSPLPSGQYHCVTEPVKDNSHKFCNGQNCLYSESADLCLDAPSEFTRPGSVKVFPGGILPKATVKLVDSITNTSKEVQVLDQSQSEIKIKLPAGENVVFEEAIQMLNMFCLFYFKTIFEIAL